MASSRMVESQKLQEFLEFVDRFDCRKFTSSITYMKVGCNKLKAFGLLQQHGSISVVFVFRWFKLGVHDVFDLWLNASWTC